MISFSFCSFCVVLYIFMHMCPVDYVLAASATAVDNK
jgi:hypothetical protein